MFRRPPSRWMRKVLIALLLLDGALCVTAVALSVAVPKGLVIGMFLLLIAILATSIASRGDENV